MCYPTHYSCRISYNLFLNRGTHSSQKQCPPSVQCLVPTSTIAVNMTIPIAWLSLDKYFGSLTSNKYVAYRIRMKSTFLICKIAPSQCLKTTINSEKQHFQKEGSARAAFKIYQHGFTILILYFTILKGMRVKIYKTCKLHANSAHPKRDPTQSYKAIVQTTKPPQGLSGHHSHHSLVNTNC